MRLNFYNLFTLVQPTTVTLYNPYVPVNTYSPQQLRYNKTRSSQYVQPTTVTL